MTEPLSPTAGKRHISNHGNISGSWMRSSANSRSFTVAENYARTNISTTHRLGEPNETDLEQLDLEDFEDFTSDDDHDSVLDLENFDLDELDLYDIDLDVLDDEDRHTLTRWLQTRNDVRLLYQGHRIPQHCALQLVARSGSAINPDTKLSESEDEDVSYTDESEDSEAAESSEGDTTPQKAKRPPVIDGDDWMKWCE